MGDIFKNEHDLGFFNNWIQFFGTPRFDAKQKTKNKKQNMVKTGEMEKCKE